MGHKETSKKRQERVVAHRLAPFSVVCTMSQNPSNEWADLADDLVANHRRHAGYFSYETDGSVAEAGVLKAFQDALAHDGEEFFSQAHCRGSGNDPPDCEAVLHTGARVGIEITELVDPDAAADARAEKFYEEKDWREDLIPKLDQIIRKKDTPSDLKDAPHSEYVLLIHTDEPRLELDYIRCSLAKHIFAQTNLITRAYLLISYDPMEKRCPCIRLNIERKPSAAKVPVRTEGN